MGRAQPHVPLPAKWIADQRGQLGEEADRLIAALDAEAPVSIRLNPRKPISIAGSPVPWCANGRYLEQRPVFTLDPLLHAGCYYVQEAGSMLLEQAIISADLVDRPLRALDLCAAPGGKSTHLLSLLDPRSVLVSNEAVRSRQAALIENLWKWGAPNSVITGSGAEAFASLGPMFDLVLIDAPCSGEGMFRKDHFAREQWSRELVRRCAITQSAITDHAWQALAPGGTLIYGTCTWERAENQDQVRRLIEGHGAEPISIPMEEGWGVDRTDLGLRCYPHSVKGEGFFIAAVRKPGVASLRSHITVAEVVDRLRTAVHFLHPNSERAEGNAPDLALVLRNSGPGIEKLEVDREVALRYLRGEALPAKGASGHRAVTFQGFAIGLVKGAGNRWNNLHPKPWRIRMR